jgi:preprotein translocase subunit YajC
VGTVVAFLIIIAFFYLLLRPTPKETKVPAKA